MDDEYDLDDFDGDFEQDDDFDSDDDDSENDLSNDEIEIAGSLDGEFDGEHDTPLYDQYGASVGLDELTDEQRELYDNAYHAGHDVAE